MYFVIGADNIGRATSVCFPVGLAGHIVGEAVSPLLVTIIYNTIAYTHISMYTVHRYRYIYPLYLYTPPIQSDSLQTALNYQHTLNITPQHSFYCTIYRVKSQNCGK